MDAFILDRRIGNLSPRTIGFYEETLQGFLNWCNQESVVAGRWGLWKENGSMALAELVNVRIEVQDSARLLITRS